VALSSCWRCPPQTDVPTPAQIEALRALREAALDPCPQGVLGFELWRLLALARGLDRLVVGLQSNRELAWGSSRRSTCQAGGARTTRGPDEPDADDRVARDIVARPSIDAGMTLGTVRLLRVPIDDKDLQVIALASLSLPAIRPKGGPTISIWCMVWAVTRRSASK
jgi:hypothetical protein